MILFVFHGNCLIIMKKTLLQALRNLIKSLERLNNKVFFKDFFKILFLQICCNDQVWTADGGVVTPKHPWTLLLSNNSEELTFLLSIQHEVWDPAAGPAKNDATHELGLHHIIYTCSLQPDLMRSGRMEPTAEASNRPQTSCSPLWKMEVNGRENDILLPETLQFAADHRKLHVAKNPQKKLQNRERERESRHPHLWMERAASGKCMRRNRPIILIILNLFIYKSAPFESGSSPSAGESSAGSPGSKVKN